MCVYIGSLSMIVLKAYQTTEDQFHCTKFSRVAW